MKNPARVLPTLLAALAFAAASTHAQVTIEALVDGPSALHVTTKSIFWENSENAKPGRWSLANEPTFVDDKKWFPEWHKPDESRGEDRCDPYPVALPTTNLEVVLLSVSKERGQPGIEERSPLSVRNEIDHGEFVIVIPDPEPEPRWYKFQIRTLTNEPDAAAK